LPLMGRLFGIYKPEVPRDEIFKEAIDRKAVEKGGIFPEKPTISSEDWQKIKNFYLFHAPKRLNQTNWEEDKITLLEGFDLIEPEEDGKLSNITFLKAGPDHSSIYVRGSSGDRGSVSILNKENNFEEVYFSPRTA